MDGLAVQREVEWTGWQCKGVEWTDWQCKGRYNGQTDSVRGGRMDRLAVQGEVEWTDWQCKGR